MILILKTSDDTTELWLHQASGTGGAFASSSWVSGRALADQLLEHLMEFLGEHGQTPQMLTGIVVYSGPGSFTSLRIGHTVANALASSLGIPVAGATGKDWQQSAIKALKATSAGYVALPFYGAEANISKPKT